MWFEILIRLSEMYGWKHAVFSPETGLPEEVFEDLIQMKARKDTHNDYNNKMDEMAYQIAKDWVNKHFMIIDGGDQMMSALDFYEVVDIIEVAYGIKFQTTTIDPFNDLTHDFTKDSNRQDLYIEKTLTYVRQNARKNHRHNCIITHTQKTEKRKHGGTNKWYYPVVTPHEVAGGQAWYRKGLMMLSVWRPPSWFEDENGQPVDTNETWVFVQKFKPKLAGKKGFARIMYNTKEHRYYHDGRRADLEYE